MVTELADFQCSPNVEETENLREEIHRYGKKNLASIHVLIQNPYVLTINRDVAMSFTSYIANTGGLLGLCLGFSFVSAIEVFFWCIYCCVQFKKKTDFL